MPSGLLVTKEPTTIITILGSCISVCVWDKQLLFGGANHYMLPLWNGSGLASPKFGNIAIEMLLEKMQRLGSQKKNLVVKMFGGAKMLQEQSNIFNIGEKNILVAYEIFRKEEIIVSAASTGGIKGRKIFFNTQTGDVFQKYLPGSEETMNQLHKSIYQ
jgi:chemotaxis protein CheD